MARKKGKAKKQNNYVEFKGLMILLFSVIGILGEMGGLFSNFLTSVAMFFLGRAYYFIFLLGIYIGLHMLFKQKFPNFRTTRFYGILLLYLPLLLFFSSRVVGMNISILSYNYEIAVDNLFGSYNYTVGAGIIGDYIYLLFTKLFNDIVIYIIMGTMVVLGFVSVTGISLISKIKVLIANIRFKKMEEKATAEIKQTEKEYEEDKRVVISSVDDVIKKVEESKKEDVEDDEIIQEKAISSIGYQLPPIKLLNHTKNNTNPKDEQEIKETIKTLESILQDFDINGKVVAINVGPTVTQYELELKSGTKVNKILGINKEIALGLAAKDVRIQAPIPSKKTVGIEIPNKKTKTVTVREILESVPKSLNDSKLLVTLGRNLNGRPIYAEINKTPHLLVAGATGSGKSVCINSIIVSILMRTKPDEVKLVLVDPKKVELNMYNGVPHLSSPVISDPRKANIALKKIVSEMDRRYEVFSDNNVKNIAGYNALIEKKNKLLDDENKIAKLPYIVVIIDELADLMLVAAKEVEDSVTRITQMARAAGIHLIVATQRPSTDVITGLIKANIPSRIAFAVSSSIDSRTILDSTGAEKLLGKGDMLFLPTGENTALRVQGTFISDEEIRNVVEYTIEQQKAEYDESLTIEDGATDGVSHLDNEADDEPLYNEIVEFVIREQKASASLLQRRFKIGYNRAARAIDVLENRGIIGPNNGSKPREVLVKLEEEDE